MNLSRSSIGLHSFQGLLLSSQKARCVTHVSGMNCYLSLRFSVVQRPKLQVFG
jgi:hypothetical protein